LSVYWRQFLYTKLAAYRTYACLRAWVGTATSKCRLLFERNVTQISRLEFDHRTVLDDRQVRTDITRIE